TQSFTSGAFSQTLFIELILRELLAARKQGTSFNRFRARLTNAYQLRNLHNLRARARIRTRGAWILRILSKPIRQLMRVIHALDGVSVNAEKRRFCTLLQKLHDIALPRANIQDRTPQT